MPPDRNAATVLDMLAAGKNVLNFVHGISREQFLADAKTRAERACERDGQE